MPDPDAVDLAALVAPLLVNPEALRRVIGPPWRPVLRVAHRTATAPRRLRLPRPGLLVVR